MNLLRPKKSIDFKGDWNTDGILEQPGTQQLLDRIVLDFFDEAMLKKDFSNFKTTIIFTNTKLGPELNNYLGLKYPGIPQEQRPWMWNHSERDKATVQDLFNRVQPGHPHQIRIIITTTCMLMGLNIPDISIVVNLGEVSNLSDLWQAAGRGGRRIGGVGPEKNRLSSIVYNLLNPEDMAHHTNQSVKNFMKSTSCLRRGENGLMKHFGWESDSSRPPDLNCCSNCDP